MQEEEGGAAGESPEQPELPVAGPAELLRFCRSEPLWAAGTALNTLLVFWLCAAPVLGAGKAALGCVFFLFLWAALAALLPTAFKILFFLLILGAAAGSFLLLARQTADLLSAGLFAASATAALALILIAVFRPAILLPALLAGLAGLAAYLEMGAGGSAAGVGAMAALVVFSAAAALCHWFGTFVIAFAWIAALGVVAQAAVSTLFLGFSAGPAEAKELLGGAILLLKKGPAASELWTILGRAWAPLRPPAALGAWILLVSALLGAVRHRLSMRKPVKVYDPETTREAGRALAMGEDLLREGRFDEALKFFDKVAELDSVHRPTGQYFVALVLLRKGEQEMGKRAASRLDSGILNNQQRYNLGSEFERNGELEEAQAFFERLYAAAPGYGDVRERIDGLRRRLADVSGDEIAHLVAQRVIDRRYADPKLIARGAMGFVFKCRDTRSNNRDTAVKVMSPLLSEGKKEAAARFIREAELVSRISHPNVIKIYEVFPGALPYFSMEFVRSQSLADILKIRGRLERDAAVEIAAQICDGLQAAHENSVIHRDVKPGNVLVDEEMDVKLVDFGIAKFEGATQLTQTGAAVGTPLYMSPEQVRGEPVGPFSDVYSAGVVLYEMLAGRPPFEEMTQHATSPAPALPAEAQVPEHLAGALWRALAKSPAERYASAREFAETLRSWRKLASPGSPEKGAGGLVDLSG